MPKPPRIYTRLTRSAASIGSYKSLWLASDHLMVVTSTGYTEEYQRLQLREIKGFFVIASERRLWSGFPWAMGAAISGVTMGVTLYSKETPVFSATILVLCALVLLWNHLLGPGCKTYVVTGVQTAVLPSLVRRRKADRFLKRILPLIESAQADLVVAPVPPPAAVDPVSPPPVA